MITYWRAGEPALDQPLLLAGLEADAELAQLRDEAAVLLVLEPLRDRLRAVRADALRRLELLRASRPESRSIVPKWRASLCAVIQPTSGMLRPKRTRENGWAFDCSIAASAFAAEISP